MKRWQQYHQPPRAPQKAQLDNILLIPASALSEKARYQAVANQLPRRGILIVTPKASKYRLFETIAWLFREHGRHVAVIAL